MTDDGLNMSGYPKSKVMTCTEVQSKRPQSLAVTKSHVSTLSQARSRPCRQFSQRCVSSLGQPRSAVNVCSDDTSFTLHALRTLWLHRLQCGYAVHARTHAHTPNAVVMVWACSNDSLISASLSLATLNAFCPGVWARKRDTYLRVISHTRRGIAAQGPTASFDRMHDSNHTIYEHSEINLPFKATKCLHVSSEDGSISYSLTQALTP